MEKYSEQADLEKNNLAEQVASTKTEEKSMIFFSNKKIGGWLLVFLIMLGGNGFISFISYFEAYFKASSHNDFLAFTCLFMGLFIFGWTAYTISSFIKRERNAVFVAKCCLFIYMYITLLAAILGGFENDELGTTGNIARALMWYILWFCFLYYSKQVEEMFPKRFRKAFTRDYYLMGFFMAATLILLTLSIINNVERKGAANIKTDIINTEALDENEYTDGQFVFCKPDGFTVEREEKKGNIVFKAKQGDDEVLLLYCGYNRDDSYENFYTAWEASRNAVLKDIPYDKISDKKRSIHSNVCYHKIVQFGEEIQAFWQFAVLFDKKSGKTCAINYVHLKEGKDHMDEVLSSIRFR